MKVLKSMKIGKKIGVIVVAMLIPIALLATLYAQNSLREVTRVTRQAGGIPYVVEARNLMQAMADHRAFSTKAKEGDSGAASQASEARTRAANSFAALHALVEKDDDACPGPPWWWCCPSPA